MAFRPSVDDHSTRHTLWVGNLPSDVQERDLRQAFSRCGEITSCTIPRRYAFVQFANDEGASIALRELDGSEIYGNKITVNRSKTTVGGHYDRHHADWGRGRRSGRDGDYHGDWKPLAAHATSGEPSTECYSHSKETKRYGENVIHCITNKIS